MSNKQNAAMRQLANVDQAVPAWIQTMRAAAMDSLSVDDVKAIVQAQVARAKDGDKNAIKFIFDQVLGGVALKGATFVQNVYEGGGDTPDKPTRAQPGTGPKIERMRRRAEAGLPLCAAEDGPEVDLT